MSDLETLADWAARQLLTWNPQERKKALEQFHAESIQLYNLVVDNLRRIQEQEKAFLREAVGSRQKRSNS